MPNVGGKRARVAQWCERVGLHRALAMGPGRDVLLVLNYHRIGSSDGIPSDPDLFSATAEEFNDQIAYAKRYLRFVTLAEVIEAIESRQGLGGPAALVTLDDGYLDNYELAFPVLRMQQIQGLFFLATSMVGSSELPWWDEIAYLVASSGRANVQLNYPAPLKFQLAPAKREATTRSIIELYKTPGVDGDLLVQSVAEAFDVPRGRYSAKRAFLNWDEAREMIACGMAVGSHTHSHRILAKLSAEQQYYEAFESRRILEAELAVQIETFAYPVGLTSSFSETTKTVLQRAGYRVAFSYYGGVNRLGTAERYNLLRCGVGGAGSGARYRMQILMATRTGRFWP